MVEFDNKFILSNDKGYVDNMVKNYLIQRHNNDEKVREIKKSLQESWEIYKKNILNKSVLKVGNLVEARDEYNNLDRYVCQNVNVKIFGIDDPYDISNVDTVDPNGDFKIVFLYTFFKMRKNSEKSFNKTLYSSENLQEIKIVDQSKNYLINDEIELF